jgi:TolB-like protein/AraC-like DNA-binding protein/Tfp pilus assembly protein PilF
MLAPNNSIAVLPFVNMSSDPENEYFSDGITEEIINALTKIEGLQVTARTSSFAFKGKNQDIRDIGRKLGVETVLEGSVRKAGKKVRITAQLINVQDGYHFWAENYDRKVEDIFAVQDDISLKIAEKMREHFGHFNIQEHLVESATQNIEAYQLYLKGRYYGNQWTPDASRKAILIYQEAIDMEPSFALPYAGMADVFSAMGALSFMSAQEAFTTAKEFANKALELNSRLPECHVALANIYFWFEWEFGKSYEELNKAIDLAPGNAEARGFLGLYRAITGELESGKRLLEEALKADPYSLQLHYAMCALHQIDEDYESALKAADKVLGINPAFDQIQCFKGFIYYQTGALTKAVEIFEKFPLQGGGVAQNSAWLACCYQRMGDAEKASGYIWQAIQTVEKDNFPPYMLYAIALYYFHEGDLDKVFDYLERGISTLCTDFVIFKQDPLFKPLKQDSRYKKLIRRIDRKFGHFIPAAELPKYAHSKLSETDACEIDRKLLNFMKEEKPYLDNQLSLRQLAEDLEVNTNYLSQVINERHEKNFFEFINAYRVTELKEKLEDPQNRQFTILSLAFDCGFNSKTTFNTAFKRITGCTPSQYLKQIA